MGLPLSTKFNDTLELDVDDNYGVASAVLDDISAAASAAATANSNAATAQGTATAAGSAASAAQATADAAVPKALFDANTILTADTDNTPAALAVALSRLIGRKSSGGIAALTAAEILALVGLPSDPTTLLSKTLFDANTILTADTDDTPVALTIAASRFVGRKATGGITALTAAEALVVLGLPSDPTTLVSKTLFDANTILTADTDDTPAALTVAASRFVGRKSTGGIAPLTAAEALVILGLPSDPTTLVNKTLFDANTILTADTDDTPVALTIAASRVVGRKSTGGIAALTGIDLATLIDSMTAFAFSSNAATLDLSTGKNFQATNALAGASTITITNGWDGANGVIIVVQDGTGSRTLSFTISGRTVKKDLNVPDTNPLIVANSQTIYQYLFYTVAGTACVMLNRIFLA